MFPPRPPRALLALSVGALLALSAPRAAAAPIVFDFNSLSPGANSATIQSYMSGLFGAASGFAATTSVTGAYVERNYTGDDHVVGPLVNGSVRPHTLGTTDGGVEHPGRDSFLANALPNDRITITFPVPVYAVSFDYQLFPDDKERADISFAADGTLIFYLRGVKPGTNGTFLHSPDSLRRGLPKEESIQLLGTYSGVFPQGVRKLEFIDWPERIGIDNLSVDPSAPLAPAPVPEPVTAATWAAGLLGLLVSARRLRRAPSPAREPA